MRHFLRAIMRTPLLATWPRGVTVSTLDSESSDRGSNPREASLCFRARAHLPMANSTVSSHRGRVILNLES